MREYILTEHEKNEIAKYNQTGIETPGLQVLKRRMRNSYARLYEDFTLIRETLEKMDIPVPYVDPEQKTAVQLSKEEKITRLSGQIYLLSSQIRNLTSNDNKKDE